MMDINNGIIKVVRSLASKRYRDEEGLFVAEGTKCVRDTWHAFDCRWLIATRAWYDQMGTAEHYDKIVFASRANMARISQFDTPSDVIAVYEKPTDHIDEARVANGLNLVLDNIQDPGNLGTIIRLADWFGVSDIFASPTTVDVFNHKVVQATMGAIARVQVHYGDLEAVFDQWPQLPVYGTFLDGDDIYRSELGSQGFVVLGNEGRGISAPVAARASHRLLIPKSSSAHSESLNVGVAAAIVMSEFARRSRTKAEIIRRL